MKKRVLSAWLALVMLLTLLPTYTVSAATVDYNQNSSRNATITITDENQNPITNATVKVTRGSNTYTVEELGNGRYAFTRDTTLLWNSFDILVEKAGYKSTSISIRASTAKTEIELEEVEIEIATFKVFYIANGSLPSGGYAGSGDAANYGPSGDNTPLVQINVNLTKLREIAAQDNSPVVYEASGSTYSFTPRGDVNDANAMENVTAFWAAVVTCVDEDSIKAFEETGLYEDFQGYCLKKQGDGSLHSDGILKVNPPVYVVELYQNDLFFGGAVTDRTVRFPTVYSLLDQYEAHLKHTITWEEDGNGKPLRQNDGTYDYYTGTYIDYNTHKIHVIEVYQYDAQGAQICTNDVDTSEFPYAQQTSSYYLARFNMRVDKGTDIQHVVTYTDGVSTEVIFNDHEYSAVFGQKVPEYTGITTREDYIFQGWALEGDNSEILYSTEEAAMLDVTGNMTFHAVWLIVPKYTGTVKIVLNGTYNSATGTLTSGTLVDAETILGLEKAEVYVSADGQTYFPLTHTETGVYSGFLKNGNYQIYHSVDGQTFYSDSGQILTIENADRERYIFYNSVVYDLNGGTLSGTTDHRTEYYHNGKPVTILDTIPVREGYIFGGWQGQVKTYQPGEELSPAIERAYTFTAQWIEAADVYVHIKINHVAVDGDHNNDNGMHDIVFTVDTRENNSSDYTEVYQKAIEWDGQSTYLGDDYNYSYTSLNDKEYTSYMPLQPNVLQVAKDHEYTVTVTKAGYTLLSVTREDEGGEIHLYAELEYDPLSFDFAFAVELDEESKTLPQNLWPKAVNVKVLSWYDTPYDEDYGLSDNDQAVDWYTFPRQRYTYERVELDQNGVGSGFYSVPIATTDDKSLTYLYRIEVVSYELQDGTIVAATDINKAHTRYEAEDYRYIATVDVTGGTFPTIPTTDELAGAYYQGSAQQGVVKAIVNIPVFTVTFDPNGGTLNDTTQETVLEKQIIVPDLSLYVPTREGGYVFDGWYVYENGQMTDIPAVSGGNLTEDMTFIAKWRDPLTVNGMITVGATYEWEGDFREILSNDRATHVDVLLQKKLPSGYYETIAEQVITVTYEDDRYYFNGRPVGVGNYDFTALPNDGSEYRITVLSANYTATYQDEPDSVDAEKRLQYDTYTIDKYMALLGNTEPFTATVNAHMHFSPSLFDLAYQVDASQINSGFRPQITEILITCDTGDATIVSPDQWTVITQMVKGEQFLGEEVRLSNDGLGSDTFPVWRVNHDGASKYDYAMRLYTVDGNTYTENPYYDVVYQAPAHYDPNTHEQNQVLLATLVPKTYAIQYELYGGTIFGEHPHSHTWSYETAFENIVPVRDGYRFGGWYTDAEFKTPFSADHIDANTAQEIRLYAKWIQISIRLQVVIDHKWNDRTATDFDKLLVTQLMSREQGSDEPFAAVDGHSRSYDRAIWHTENSEVDYMGVRHVHNNLSERLDYNVAVTIPGYKTVDQYVYTGIDEQGNTVTETIFTGVTRNESKESDYWAIEHDVIVCLEFDPTLSFGTVVFHKNNEDALGDDVFRVYYPAEVTAPDGGFSLNEEGIVPNFYDIPTFEYTAHNNYVFKGWYTDPDGGVPLDLNTAFDLLDGADDVHFYAQWITVGSVAKEEKDTKNTGGDTYAGFDLIGTQIRESEFDSGDYHGTAGSGLRFITVLSESVYAQINELSAQNALGAEYGFVVALANTAKKYAGETEDYMLQYAGSNVNGMNTTTTYKYVKNMKCSGVRDHYAGEQYRLYTAVITYGDNAAAKAKNFVARSYIRYMDANGLLRTHYNNYTGNSRLYGACNTSFSTVRAIVTNEGGGTQ